MTSINRREALKRVALLCGGALSAPTVAGILSGCQTNDGSDAWSPAALSDHQNELVVTISEHIIPATDTGGAEAAQVNRFIDAMLADGFLPEDRNRFLAGLDEVDDQAATEHDAPFLECSSDEQMTLVTAWDEAAFSPSANIDAEAPPFFRTMKELTIYGYYTSEIGASEELRFDPVMGRYDPCVPVEEIGRAWA